MSLLSFLKKIFDAISGLFNDLQDELKAAVHIGVITVENMKAFADSNVADILTAVIPGDLDDKIKDLLRSNLPILLKELKLVEATLGLTDPNEIVKAALKALNELEGDIKSAFLHDLSVLIAQVAADGKLSWQDGVYIMQWYYQHKYEKVA